MKIIAVTVASLLVVACSTTQRPSPTPTSGEPSNTTQANASDVTTAAGLMNAPVSAASSVTGTTTRPAVNEQGTASLSVAEQQAVQKQSVYFDFDKFAVKPEFQNALQNQANYIRQHDHEVVTLVGNADERGSNEYNLALGSKRAEAVEKSLELLGIPAKQIKTVSYGEEKPRLVCHEEKCWKENRRVDFVFSSSTKQFN